MAKMSRMLNAYVYVVSHLGLSPSATADSSPHHIKPPDLYARRHLQHKGGPDKSQMRFFFFLRVRCRQFKSQLL